MIYYCYKYKKQGGLIYEDEEKTMVNSIVGTVYWYYPTNKSTCDGTEGYG
mgnify:CR=1 FL=1